MRLRGWTGEGTSAAIERTARLAVLLGGLLGVVGCVAPSVEGDSSYGLTTRRTGDDDDDGDRKPSAAESKVTPPASSVQPPPPPATSSDAQRPTTAPDLFGGAGPFKPGPSLKSANDNHLTSVTGRACMECHGSSDETSFTGSIFGVFAPRFMMGGTVYRGSQPAAGVEIRVVDASGAVKASTFSDSDGNFWVKGESDLTGAKTGVRGGSGAAAMKAALPNGNCNTSGCHDDSRRITVP